MNERYSKTHHLIKIEFLQNARMYIYIYVCIKCTIIVLRMLDLTRGLNVIDRVGGLCALVYIYIRILYS